MSMAGTVTRLAAAGDVNQGMHAVGELDVDALHQRAGHRAAPELRVLDQVADLERLGRGVREYGLLRRLPRDPYEVGQRLEQRVGDLRRRQAGTQRALRRELAGGRA